MRMWIIMMTTFAASAAVMGGLKYRVSDDYSVEKGFKVRRRFSNIVIDAYAAVVAIVTTVTLFCEDANGLFAVASGHLGRDENPIWVIIFVMPLVAFLIWYAYANIVIFIAKIGVSVGYNRTKKKARRMNREVMRHYARE